MKTKKWFVVVSDSGSTTSSTGKWAGFDDEKGFKWEGSALSCDEACVLAEEAKRKNLNLNNK